MGTSNMGRSGNDCDSSGLGESVATLFAAVASTPPLLGSVNGVLVQFDDVLDMITVTGADGVSGVPRTGVRVELTFKPQSPLNHADLAAAASDWVATSSFPMVASYCGCTSAFTITEASSWHGIDGAASGKKGKKGKTCKGAFSPPTGKGGTGERSTGSSPGASTAAGSSGGVVGVGLAAVVLVAVALVGMKRLVRRSTGLDQNFEQAPDSTESGVYVARTHARTSEELRASIYSPSRQSALL